MSNFMMGSLAAFSLMGIVSAVTYYVLKRREELSKMKSQIEKNKEWNIMLSEQILEMNEEIFKLRKTNKEDKQ